MNIWEYLTMANGLDIWSGIQNFDIFRDVISLHAQVFPKNSARSSFSKKQEIHDNGWDVSLQ